MSKRQLMITLLAAAAAAILMLGFQESTARAENHCVSGELCAWTGTFYGGTEWSFGCPANVGDKGLWFQIGELRSAKNRCSGQYLRLAWYEGGVYTWKVCMAPGGERPEPGRWNIYERVAGC